MNAQATGTSGKEGDAASTTIGVGGVTSGQSGATPGHETQRETGGSGGEELTRNQDRGDATAGAAAAKAFPSAKPGADPAAPTGAVPEAPESSMLSGARGAFDTRSAQGGGTGTGLGSPESGANQSERDLPPSPLRDGAR